MIVRLAFVILFSAASLLAQPFWPTRGWRMSTPERQGMDSNKLAEAVEFILGNNVQAHSLLVIRNGFIVADAYFYPYRPNTRHDVASVTKSVTSTLIGIAVDEGLIGDLSLPALGFFAERKAANLDERKKAMSVESLLLMESGLACVSSPTEETLFRMIASPDWIQFMLDRPMSEAPGTRFVYNSGAVHLLSAIVTKTAGMSALEFARRRLFEPLGITDVRWPLDPSGTDNHGWGDLQLRPHDMAKIGYLFLNHGRWEDKQVLSARWVQAATQKRVSLPNGESYGYLWWMTGRPPGLIEARGRGGQRIIIWPEKNIIIVFTGGGFEPGRVGPFLIEAVKSDQPLAPDPNGVARLEKSIRRAADPPTAAKGESTALPDAARAISGKRFVLEPNPRGLRALTLTFKDQREAVLNVVLAPGVSDNPRLEFRLGLDGVPRMVPGRFDMPVFCKGIWKTPDIFVVDIDEVGNINRLSLELEFRDGRVAGQFADGLGPIPIKGEIK